MESKKYRLYIDESGTHNYNSSTKIRERYLCLLGIIISSEYNEEFLVPKWEELRDLFTEDVDFPAIFHYVDVVCGAGVFRKLLDIDFRESFDGKYLELLKIGDFVICCVVLDKKSHIDRYGTSAMHPYHYCLNVLLERYVRFLSTESGVGDVVAEARGKKEDNLLRSEFARFYEDGTSFLESEIVQKRLTSHKLKLKSKEARIAVLELSDMLATPMKFLVLEKYKIIKELDDNFTKIVLKNIYSKIRRHPITGVTDGFGIKLI